MTEGEPIDDDAIEGVLRRVADVAATETPQEKVERYARMAARGGLTLTDAERDELLAEFMREAGSLS